MTSAQRSFNRELQTELRGRFRGIAIRAHLSLTMHGAGMIGDDLERDLFIDVLKEAIRALQDDQRKENQ